MRAFIACLILSRTVSIRSTSSHDISGAKLTAPTPRRPEQQGFSGAGLGLSGGFREGPGWRPQEGADGLEDLFLRAAADFPTASGALPIPREGPNGETTLEADRLSPKAAGKFSAKFGWFVPFPLPSLPHQVPPQNSKQRHDNRSQVPVPPLRRSRPLQSRLVAQPVESESAAPAFIPVESDGRGVQLR